MPPPHTIKLKIPQYIPGSPSSISARNRSAYYLADEAAPNVDPLRGPKMAKMYNKCCSFPNTVDIVEQYCASVLCSIPGNGLLWQVLVLLYSSGCNWASPQGAIATIYFSYTAPSHNRCHMRSPLALLKYTLVVVLQCSK